MASFISLALAALAVGPGAAAPAIPHSSPPSLDQSAWILAALPGHPLVPQYPATIHFRDGKVNGTDGCNSYSGSYRAEGERFEIAPDLATTNMACPERLMKQADAFQRALANARAARVHNGRLVFLDASGAATARFILQSNDLAGTAWEVTGYNNGRQAVVSVTAGSRLTLQFGADGRVSGSAGCNRFTGPYTSSADRVAIGKLAATRKVCNQPRNVMEQEDAFLKALSSAAAVRVDANRLELRTGGDAIAVVAARRDPHGAPTSAGAASAPPGLRLPATFLGDLPCADCSAIRYHLDLWPDGVFHLRREWVGRNTVRDELGRWRFDAGGNALVLKGSDDLLLQFEIQGPDVLRQLDAQGKPIQSKLPYELHSEWTLVPTDLSLSLAGEMTYLADAARFTECLTGRSYPIAQEADFIAMQKAYREGTAEPGAKVYVTFDGSITSRPRMEGEGMVRSVVVNRFGKSWPGKHCEGHIP